VYSTNNEKERKRGRNMKEEGKVRRENDRKKEMST
jgi:hypothetical protein